MEGKENNERRKEKEFEKRTNLKTRRKIKNLNAKKLNASKKEKRKEFEKKEYMKTN